MKRLIFCAIIFSIYLSVWAQSTSALSINDLVIRRTYNCLSIATPQFTAGVTKIAGFPIGVNKGNFTINNFIDKTMDLIIESHYVPLYSDNQEEEEDVTEVYEDVDLVFVFFNKKNKLKCKGTVYKSAKSTQVVISEKLIKDKKTLIDILFISDIQVIGMINDDGTIPVIISYHDKEAEDKESDYTHTSTYFRLVYDYLNSIQEDQ